MGKRSTMAMTSERTLVSSLAATNWLMLASRSPQYPDSMQSVWIFFHDDACAARKSHLPSFRDTRARSFRTSNATVLCVRHKMGNARLAATTETVLLAPIGRERAFRYSRERLTMLETICTLLTSGTSPSTTYGPVRFTTIRFHFSVPPVSPNAT